MLRDGQPWQPQEIQHLINEEFGVEYHPVYLIEFLKNLGLTHAIPRTKRPTRPDNSEEILDERVDDALAEGTDEPHNKRENDDDEGWVVNDDTRCGNRFFLQDCLPARPALLAGVGRASAIPQRPG